MFRLLFPCSLIQQFPKFARRVAGPGNVATSQLRIALSHLDIRVAEDLGKFLKIAAVHHVSGREGTPQVVKTKVRDRGPNRLVREREFYLQVQWAQRSITTRPSEIDNLERCKLADARFLNQLPDVQPVRITRPIE
jgi:hypothetical protein